jgi:hypothetical protein
MWIGNPSKLISSVLSPAVRFWLRSQLEAIKHLDLSIQGQDRQLLGGYIPRVYLKAHQAIYQGVHLEQVQVWAENTRINIGQILKGKPLQLQEPLRISAEALLREADLNNSLTSFTLSNALNDLLIFLLQAGGIENAKPLIRSSAITWQSLRLEEQSATVEGIFSHPQLNPTPFKLSVGLSLLNPQTLEINPLDFTILPLWSSLDLHTFSVDLGSSVRLDKLSIIQGEIFCWGRLEVVP